MQSHMIGCIQGVRPGADLVEHSYPIDFDRPTAIAFTLGTVPASAVKPALVDGFLIIQTPSNGTTHSISVTIGGAALIAPGTDLKGAANTKTAGTPRVIVANSDLVATPTITGVPTAGRAWLCMQARELNVDKTAK